jgi:hypothetical protein
MKLIICGSTWATDRLFFPVSEVVDQCYGYWIASPGAESDASLVSVLYMGYICNYTKGSKWLGVCPVICLPSDVGVSYDSTELIWKLKKK